MSMKKAPAVLRNCAAALLATALGLAPLLLGNPVYAGSTPSADPPLRLINVIPIKGTAANAKTSMYSFDISYLDPSNGLYYLGDRSNASIDIIDTTGTNKGICGATDTGPDTFCGQIGGPAAGFTGFTGSNDTSGPDGVLAAFPCVFAGNGNSTLLSFNFASLPTPVSTIATGGTTRVDEMAFDPKDNTLIAANNAESPPFTTLVTVNRSSCQLSNPIKTTLNTLPTATNISGAVTNPTVTNGAEQPVWDPVMQRFYQPIPEVSGNGGTGPFGGLAQINPVTGAVEAFFQINYCQPSGAAAGPNGDILLQCSVIFDNAGNACVAAAPSPGGQNSTIRKAGCTGISEAQVVICNPSRGCTPTNGSLVSVKGPGGGDEAWFNPGDGNYYITQANNPVGSSLGVVASGSTTTPNTLVQMVPTLPPQGAKVTTSVGTTASVSGTVHSVAASAVNNHVYVPIPANTAYAVLTPGSGAATADCTQGCVAVFSAQ